MLGLLLLSALLAPSASLRAGNLYVPNYSFESPATSFVFPGVDAWQESPQPSSFDTNVFGEWGNLIGVFANAPATNADFIGNADGSQLAYLFAYPGVELFQDVNSTDWSGAAPTHAFNAVFQVGNSYHLTVGLTSSSEEPLTPGSTLLLGLYYRDASGNQVIVAANTVTFSTNVFTNLTQLIDFEVTVPSVTTNDAWAGQDIGIQILSTVGPDLIGGVWDLDNVRLTETIDVPNFSFEMPATAYVFPGIDSWEEAAQPSSFDTNLFGLWENLVGVFGNAAETNADFIDNADGSQLAYLFAYPQLAIFQDFDSTDWSGAAPSHAFNAVFRAGRSYTLTVGLTSSREEPLTPGSTLQLSLYYRDGSNNMVSLAAATATYGTNVFTNLTHLVDFQATVPEVRPGDPWAGKHIGIQFMSTATPDLIGGVWDLDNVRLTEVVATALDHPGTVNGQFGFTLQSDPGLPFEILAASSLAGAGASWTSIATFTNITGSFPFVDPAVNSGQRFYRAHQLR